jgi:hypothetical protein
MAADSVSSMWARRGAVAEQDSVQQAIRGDGGASVRERIARQGPEIHSGEEHGTSHGFALFGALEEARRKPALRQMGVDEIHLGKQPKFITVASNLETGEPLWLGESGKRRRWINSFRRS